MKRDFNPDQPEWMDRPQPVSEELEKDLQNLIGLNHYFGSHRIVRRFLSAWLQPERTYRVLDLATGAGDIPRVMADWARSRNVTLRMDAIDAQSATLEIAKRWSDAYPEIRFLQENALTYEPTETYDLVCCSLALHHFSETDAVRLLRRCRALSHRYVLVTDLERSRSTSLGVWAVTQFIYRDPMTRHDGRVSAKRAFSFAEMHQLANAAGWKNFGHTRFLFCRQALWQDQQIVGEIPLTALPLGQEVPCPT
jgi:2-polyprenyl-3-methyl-5-hydroxy-6-metoxy-1,4-benzoquinol methylase